jgi:hypothetical protein
MVVEDSIEVPSIKYTKEIQSAITMRVELLGWVVYEALGSQTDVLSKSKSCDSDVVSNSRRTVFLRSYLNEYRTQKLGRREREKLE